MGRFKVNKVLKIFSYGPKKSALFLRSISNRQLYVHWSEIEKEYIMQTGYVGAAIFDKKPAKELIKLNKDLEAIQVEKILNL